MFAKFILVVILLIASSQCLIFVPERANVTKRSSEYVGDAWLWVSRLSRKSPYFVNLAGTTKQSWYNNVTVNFVFFEHLHNEYRRSFVEMHVKFCDLVNLDPYIGKMLGHHIACPLLAGTYELLNMTVPVERFNYSLPFRKLKVEIEATLTETKKVIGAGYLYGEFKNK